MTSELPVATRNHDHEARQQNVHGSGKLVALLDETEIQETAGAKPFKVDGSKGPRENTVAAEH